MSNYDPNAYAQYGQSGAGVVRADQAAIDQGLRSYMLGIYNHMTIGLAITALVAVGVALLPRSVAMVLYGTPLKWVVMLAPLAFILVLSWRFDRMSYSSLMFTFWAFAAVMGLSMGSIFFIYKLGSIAQVFFITAAAFGSLSLFGYTTKKDLSGFGKFLLMGLFGLIIASLVSLVLAAVGVKVTALQFAINILGVVIFAGLTAYDTQRLKEEYAYVAGSGEIEAKASLMGALTLYLNFVNMFQMLLSLFGNRE
jgi:uncharacterized protein